MVGNVILIHPRQRSNAGIPAVFRDHCTFDLRMAMACDETKRLFGFVHLTFTPKMFKINVKALQQKLRDFIVKWTQRHETHRFFSG